MHKEPTYNPSLAHIYLNETFQLYETQTGKLAYVISPQLNRAFVPTDPLCPLTSAHLLIKEFLLSHPKACFGHINQQTKEILTQHNFYTKELGQENTIHLPSFSPTWQSHKGLKGLVNLGERNQITTREITKDLKSHEKALQKISQRWYRNKKSLNNNQHFLLAPNESPLPPTNRVFAAFKGSELIAYHVYSPLDSASSGYENTQCRYTSPLPKGTNDHLRMTAIQTFKQEGLKQLRLGLSPNPRFSRLQRFTRALYNHTGAATYKKRYHAKQTPIYFATNAALPWVDKLYVAGLTLGYIRPKA